MQDSGFDKLRTSTEELIAKALDEGTKTGRVTGRLVRDINTNLDNMDDQVSALTRSADLNPTDSIQAKRFLRELRASCVVLRQPNVAQSFWAEQQTRRGQRRRAHRADECPGFAFCPGGHRR